MLKFVTLSLAASAVLLAPAQAQGTNQPATNGASKSTAEKKICKQLPSSSSRHANKVCLTAEQWKKVEQER
jgi:hypothetical protein